MFRILAGGGVTFADGGLHIMPTGPTCGRFKPGGTGAVPLIFDHRGGLPVTFTVRAGPGSMDGMGRTSN